MGEGSPIAAGIAVGAAFVVLFSLVFNSVSVLQQKPSHVTILIPEGASLASLEKSYDPDYARLFIGTNNTVRWINHDVTFHVIVADSDFEPDLGIGTNKTNMVLLSPGQSFEYTFTKVGRYGYHGEPGPHMRGSIEVYPELQKDMYINVSVEDLQSSYKVGEPMTFTVAVDGYGSRCDSFMAIIENMDAPEFSYSIGFTPGCYHPESFHDFSHSFRIGPDQEFSPIYINQTGTYMLTVMYRDVLFPEIEDRVEMEFAVVD